MSKFSALAFVDQAHPRRMTIIHPISRMPMVDEAGKEAFIELHSSDGEVARKYFDAKRKAAGLQGRAKPPTQDELTAEGAEFLAALTVSWYLLDGDGKPINEPCNPVNAAELYALPAMNWLTEQVGFFTRDRANFAKASSSS